MLPGYWYGDYFSAFGYQKIKNTEDDVEQKQGKFLFRLDIDLQAGSLPSN